MIKLIGFISIVCNMAVADLNTYHNVYNIPNSKCHTLMMDGFVSVQHCKDYQAILNTILEDNEFILDYKCHMYEYKA